MTEEVKQHSAHCKKLVAEGSNWKLGEYYEKSDECKVNVEKLSLYKKEISGFISGIKEAKVESGKRKRADHQQKMYYNSKQAGMLTKSVLGFMESYFFFFGGVLVY